MHDNKYLAMSSDIFLNLVDPMHSIISMGLLRSLQLISADLLMWVPTEAALEALDRASAAHIRCF